MLNPLESTIIAFLKSKEECSSKEIFDQIDSMVSYATVKRTLTKLNAEKLIEVVGKGKATKYQISSIYELIEPIDLELYYQKEIDERKIKNSFNFQLISKILKNNNIFSDSEFSKLEELQAIYTNNTKQLSDFAFKKELERLAIDLSWKSSQIEGNTYSLLETEKLLKISKERVDSGWLFFTEPPNCFVRLDVYGYCKVILRTQRRIQKQVMHILV